MPTDSNKDKLILEDEAMRDGLQMESRIFSLAEKIELFEILQRAGIPRIQVGSFVHPGIVPQMADTDELIKAIQSKEGTVISALILNDKGLERALKCGVSHVSMSVSVSDTHSRKNAKMPATEALQKMTVLIHQALSSGLEIRAGLQSAFGCVYEGPISEEAVLKTAEAFVQAGSKEINLADSTGMASPAAVRHMIGRVSKEFPEVRISLHLRDTRGMGMANLFAGYEAGVRIFDVCTGGLGGCPFIRGAAGNVPTEDAVNMLESMGISTGIDLAVLIDAVKLFEEKLGRALPGKMKRVMDFKATCE